jgi:hypothetical protein
MSQIEIHNTINSVNVESTFNTVDVNNDISNVLVIPQQITSVVEIITPGPQGPQGPAGVGSNGEFNQFILLASGSTSNVDGGIIIQNNINKSGHAFGYGTPENRWVLQSSLDLLSTSFGTIDGYINTTQYGLLNDLPASPSYGGVTEGYGNMYVTTDTDDILIWA